MVGEQRGSAVRVRGAFSLLAVCLAFALLGCHVPQPVRTYEYVTNYERMTDAYDPLVSRAYMPDPEVLGRYRAAVVGPVTVGDGWVESRQEALGCATYFRMSLRDHLVRLGMFDSVTFEAQGALSGPDALLVESMITKFDLGSGFGRYCSGLLGFFQSGATDLQVEGRIADARTGALLVEFVDRRRHMCNTAFGPNPRTLKKCYAMNVTVRETAECLAKFIEMACKGLPPGDAGVDEADE
jgi:hypothetical protein